VISGAYDLVQCPRIVHELFWRSPVGGISTSWTMILGDARGDAQGTMNDTAKHLGAKASDPSGGLNVRWIPELREYIEGFLDPKRLTAELANYDEWASDNSAHVLQGGFLHRPTGTNMLVAAISACKEWESHRADLPPPAGAKRLAQLAFSLAALEFQASEYFDDNAREFLQQRLQAPEEVWGVICEILTSSYFIRKGTEVLPLFLQKSAHYDLMLRLGGQEVPVQCKAKKPGAGRVVADETIGLLTGCIARDASDMGRKVLVKIGSTGEVRPADVPALRKAVSSSVVGGLATELLIAGERVYSIKVEEIAGTFTVDNAGEFLRPYQFKVSLMVFIPQADGENYEPIVAVGLDAHPEESPWNSLQRSIDEASGQLTSGPPGIIAIHYADHVSDVESLRPGPEPLRYTVVPKLETCPHVGAVMISSEPDLQLPGSGAPSEARIYGIWERLPAGLFDA